MTMPDLSFGKIASNPTKTSWSQAYNAGGLFVILSLTLVDPEKEHESLAIIGKNFLNDLEAEFFSLENKNTDGISNVLEKVASEVPLSVNLETVVAFHKDTTLYLFLVGNGSINIKRGQDFGTILTQSQAQDRTIKSASGFLTPNDTLLLSSSSFKKAVSTDAIKKALSLEEINEAVEMLTPHVHQAEDASAAALIFRHKTSSQPVGLADQSIEDTGAENTIEEIKEEVSPDEKHAPVESPVLDHPPSPEPLAEQEVKVPEKKTRSLSLPLSLSSLSHRRKVILSIAAILIVVLGLSVFFTISTKQANERRELFDSIYPQALESYEEAEGLMDLNEALAREELEKATGLLAQTEGKFPENSEEYKKTKDLSGKIEGLLAQVGQAEVVDAQEISDDESLILASLKSDAVAAVEDSESIYYLTKDDIKSIRKASKSEQSLVENDSRWENPVGLGRFGSNFYVLDTENGVIKLVPNGTEYTASDYLLDDVSVKDSTSIAIDASVYILYKNGDIKKFTRGREDDFSVSGLENPLKTPVQITTTEDFDNLYILDPATARIVKLKKDGSFSSQYQTSVLQNAKAIAISSDESKAYILSDSSLYEISL